MRRTSLINLLYSLPSVAYLLVFFYAPLVTIAVLSFLKGGPLYRVENIFTFENYIRFLTEPGTVSVFLFTMAMATAVFTITVLVAYPIAYFLARMTSEKWGLRIILLILIPLEMNYLIRGFAWRNILGENGLINNLLILSGLTDKPVLFFFHNVYAVLLVILHNSLPYAIIPIYITLRSIPQSLYHAAMDLGSDRVSSFFRVTLPLSLPGIAISFLFVYIPTMGEFAIPSLVGGRTYVLGTLITRTYMVIGDWPFASTATVILTIISLAIMFLVFKLAGVRRLYD